MNWLVVNSWFGGMAGSPPRMWGYPDIIIQQTKLELPFYINSTLVVLGCFWLFLYEISFYMSFLLKYEKCLVYYG